MSGKDLWGTKIDKIVLLANKKAELQFQVFVRSLRDVGCNLPVWVIPFGKKDFEPPPGCQWIEDKDSKLLAFLRQNAAHPLYRKYMALLQNHCAYFDTDIILLREPQEWLRSTPSDAFVVADTEWAKNRWTFSADSLRFLTALSSCWPLLTFNSGFFAFEEPLYEEEELLSVIQRPEFRSTCVERKASPSTNRPSTGLSFGSSDGSSISICLHKEWNRRWRWIMAPRNREGPFESGGAPLHSLCGSGV